MATLEWHAKRLDVYLNGGEEYAQKHYGYDAATGTYTGYGVPSVNVSGCYTESAPGSGGFAFGGGCSVDTQRLIEGTMGFWVRVHQGPHGRLQFGPQYSYVVRDAWTGTLAAPFSAAPHGIDNMFFTSFRYYLP